MEAMLADFAGVLVVVVVGISVAGVLLAVQWLRLARASSSERGPSKRTATPVGEPGGRHAVKFYLVALLFVVFDVAAVFVLGWAAVFRELGWHGLTAMAVFTAPLAVALLYGWGKGALEW